MKEFSEVTETEIKDKYELISANVKRIRKEKQITQEQLALSMGFTTATFYTNAENNKRDKHFNLEHLIKISLILEVSMEEFFKEL